MRHEHLDPSARIHTVYKLNSRMEYPKSEVLLQVMLNKAFSPPREQLSQSPLPKREREREAARGCFTLLSLMRRRRCHRNQEREREEPQPQLDIERCEQCQTLHRFADVSGNISILHSSQGRNMIKSILFCHNYQNILKSINRCRPRLDICAPTHNRCRMPRIEFRSGPAFLKST